MAKLAKLRKWILVDDQAEADAFCAAFQRASTRTEVRWERMNPTHAKETLLRRSREPIAGVLVDIDLSSDPNMRGTGLGLAQDIRAKQKSKTISDYPLVRFANDAPVRRFVGNDPGSNDLFDLLVAKDEARSDYAAVVVKCTAVREVYDSFSASSFSEKAFAKLCGLSEEQARAWGDVRLMRRINASLASNSAVHVAAGTFIRSFLEPDGLLIGEELVAVRLGVDIRKSAKAWDSLKRRLKQYQYDGVGRGGFNRWWARGIEAFWFSVDGKRFLQELTVAERIESLHRKFKLPGLVGLGSPGERYWRLCTLSRERGAFVPVDPRKSVSMSSALSRDAWLEPELAAPEVAVMHRDDKRLNKEELKAILK